ncbi:MAG: hypothetical protein K2Z81_05305, partial [Cyanobacteria bacterium]|nr:hypothetical protein [Cyanobacteriota bacterium]
MSEFLKGFSELSKDDSSVSGCALSFFDAGIDAAFSKPAVAVRQFASTTRGDEFHLEEAPAPVPAPAPFSPRWHAIHAGAALGTLLPFALAAAGRRDFGRLLLGRAPLFGRTSPFLTRAVPQAALDGAVYSTLFVPAADSSTFGREKAVGAISGAITFGGMAATGSMLGAHSKIASFDLIRHGIAGSVGGAIGVASESLLNYSELPGGAELAQSAYAGAFFGLGMRALQNRHEIAGLLRRPARDHSLMAD